MLKVTLVNLLEGYTGKAFNGYSYMTSSVDQQHFVVTSVGYVHGQRVVNTGLVVQFINNMIIIDHDINNKPLVDALIQAGVSRDQIILTYAGEPVPESV
jgi:hypothetical protein